MLRSLARASRDSFRYPWHHEYRRQSLKQARLQTQQSIRNRRM